ncbi:MAG: response regulator [Bacteroidales bacterium]|nr:response regulator [Bacteroidales bacterium]
MFKELFTRLYKYFLRGYEDYSLEIQKKMKYLFIFAIAGLVIYVGLIAVRVFGESNIYLLSGDFFLLIFLLSTLFFIKHERILKAASTVSLIPISILFYHVIENTYLGYPITIDSLFATLAFIIFGILILSLFAVKVSQLLVYSGIAFITLIIHYIVMVEDTFGGELSQVSLTHFASAVMGLGISLLVGVLILNLSHELINIAERARRRSEEKYYSLFSNMMDGFAYLKYEKNPRKDEDNLVLIEANYALKNMLDINYDIENKTASQILNQLNSNDYSIVDRLINAARTGKEINEEYYLEPMDIWFHLYAFSPQRGFVVVLARNITEQKENNEALLKRDKIFMALGHAASLLIETYSLDQSLPKVLAEIGQSANVSRTYIFENQHHQDKGLCMHQLYEWTAEGITPQIDNSELQELPYNIASPVLGEKLSKGDIYFGDVNNMAQEEKDFLEPQGIKSILVVPIFIEQTWWGFVGFDECTENRKWSNAEIEALKLVADIIGASISRLQMENNLRQAKEKAEESDKLKGAFLANISHEVRTPMNAIVGFSEMITDPDIEEEDKKEYLKLIKQSSNNLLNLINDIIDLSKIETGQLDIHYREYNINELLGDIRNKFVHELDDTSQKTVSINLRIPEKSSLRYLYTDYYWLKQIITNLLENAVKFTPKGSIDLGYHVAGNEFIKFYVKDTGIGIAPHNHELIFEQFRQADNTYTREYGGTGLGLTIVKKLLNGLGGYIWVESIQGKGSVFSVMLPLTEPENKTFTHQMPAYIDEFHNTINYWKKQPILMVEKHEGNFEFIKALMGKTARIKRLTDEQKALESIRNNRPKLIMLDTDLTGEDSWKIARNINRQIPEVPIIAMSNFITPADIKRIFEMGFDDYLIKPVEPYQFFKKLEKFW